MIAWERLARAMVHPLRISILEVLMLDGGRAMSPNELRQELQMPLSNVDYHVRALVDAGMLELVGTQPRRGATEHFYRVTSEGAQRELVGAAARLADIAARAVCEPRRFQENSDGWQQQAGEAIADVRAALACTQPEGEAGGGGTA